MLDVSWTDDKTKKIYAKLPPHSEYSLIPIGSTLMSAAQQLEKWGNEFHPDMKKIWAWRFEDELFLGYKSG
ncbi:MAG: winged helix-turn-helix transcriptional regulator [Akkermansiaceae bacterium]|nr:winged helix-turn-helix transcriptional regulator [Akkermansiaceae bacterium]